MERAPYKLNLITAPEEEPVTLSEWKTYATIGTNETSTAQDTYITDILIPTVRDMVEKYLNRALITQTWEMVFDCQPDHMYVPFGQLQSVTSIKTVADDETTTTESSDNYTVETGDSGEIFLRNGATWATTTRGWAFFKVRFVAGYGDGASDVPENIKNGIYRLISYLWENRESLVSVISAGLDEIPFVTDYLYPYKIYEVV